MSELNRIRKFYSALIDTSMDGFWMIDTLGRFLEVNDIYCQMIGYSREELSTISIPDVEAMETPDDTARLKLLWLINKPGIPFLFLGLFWV